MQKNNRNRYAKQTIYADIEQIHDEPFIQKHVVFHRIFRIVFCGKQRVMPMRNSVSGEVANKAYKKCEDRMAGNKAPERAADYCMCCEHHKIVEIL